MRLKFLLLFFCFFISTLSTFAHSGGVWIANDGCGHWYAIVFHYHSNSSAASTAATAKAGLYIDYDQNGVFEVNGVQYTYTSTAGFTTSNGEFSRFTDWVNLTDKRVTATAYANDAAIQNEVLTYLNTNKGYGKPYSLTVVVDGGTSTNTWYEALIALIKPLSPGIYKGATSSSSATETPIGYANPFDVNYTPTNFTGTASTQSSCGEALNINTSLTQTCVQEYGVVYSTTNTTPSVGKVGVSQDVIWSGDAMDMDNKAFKFSIAVPSGYEYKTHYARTYYKQQVNGEMFYVYSPVITAIPLDPTKDCDNDGITNGDESPEPGKDTDGDGTPDFKDLDSDGDGIQDNVETGSTDCDADGIPDFRDLSLLPNIITQPSNSTICLGSNTSFISNVTGGGLSYQWQVKKGDAFIDLSNDATYSGAQANTLTLTNPTVSTSGFYRLIISSSTCQTTATSTEVSLIVNSTEKPSVTDARFIQGAQNVSVSENVIGSAIKWYTTEVGGTGLQTPPTINTSALGTKDYFVTQTVNGCESLRAKLTVSIVEPKMSQIITFNSISEKIYGEGDFDPEAVSDAALPITYSSDNTQVATIVDNKLHIVGVGTAIITALQSGNGAYYPAVSKQQTLTVKKKALTVTVDDKSKTYGDANPEFSVTYDGLVNRESYLKPAPTITTTATVSSGVGTYEVEATGTSANYELTFKKGTLTVNKKALTVTAVDKSKTYGDANPELTVSYDGLVNDETALSTAPNVSTTATKESGVGTYDIEVTGSSDNYDLTFKKGTLTVAKKGLTVTAENKSKTYGEVNPALTVTYSGLVNGETVLSPAPSISTLATQASGAGTYDIEATGSSDNYELTFKKGTLTVGKKALTVTAVDKSKTYGDANPELTVSYEGLVNNETALAAALNLSTTATTVSGVGTYDIEATGSSDNYDLTFKKGTLTIGKKALTVTVDDKSKTYGDANPEFSVTYDGLVNRESYLKPAPTVTTTATVSSGVGTYEVEATGTSTNYELTFKKGTLTVNKKALTVTAVDKSKTYGDANPELTVSYDGLVNDETALSTAPNVSTTATKESGVGTYDIEVTGSSDNYDLTFKKGTLTVAKKGLTVTAENKSKTYGEINPDLTITYTGLVNGETALNPAPTVSTLATQASGAGTYDIEATGTSANYALTFNKGTLTVGKKALTVAADNKNKTYGEANPALTVTYSGLVNGETALNPAPSVATTATTHSVVGTYDITASGTAANYELTFTKGVLTVGKKALTVTAENKSKIYGEANPALTLTYNGLVNGETALNPAPALSTTATAASGVGTYDITASGTAANYDLSFVTGTLTVGKKALTVTAENKSKTYGDANPALSVTYSGLVNGETALNPAPVLTTTSTEQSGIGTYDITASGAAANYTVTYVKGSLTVGKKALTITAENKEKFQGLALPTFTAAYTGFVNGETSSVLTTQPSFSTTANAMSPQGTYPISVSGATAANYAITHVPGVLTVKPGYPTSITLAASTLYENAPVNTVAGTLSSTSDDPSATFTYTLVDGTGGSDNVSFKISGNQIQTNAVLNFESKSSYNVLVRSTTQHGLSLDKAFTITLNNVNEQPTLNNIAAQTICYTPAQQTVALSGISAGEDASQTTNVTVSSTNNNLFKSLTVTQASNGNAQLRYTVAEGASGSAVVNVMVMDNGGTANAGVNTMLKSFVLNVNALPVPTITTNKGVTSISKGDELVLKAAGGTAYQWSNANGILSGDNTANLTIRPDVTTTYRVLVTNASGCSETKEITIEVTEDYVMLKGTNLISPNGDNVNDVFKIDNIDMYPNNEVKIFDRAGRMLYSKKGYSKDGEWNGTLNGAPLAEDTYYYVVDFGPNKPKIQGYITIVRD